MKDYNETPVTISFDLASGEDETAIAFYRDGKILAILHGESAEYVVAQQEVIRHQREVIERLKGALQFYESGFESYKQHKSLPGFAWRPTESLLDDCGEVAKQTLAAIEADGKERGMDMICDRCGQTGIRWMGSWSNLTHTECPHCGGVNCQRVESHSEEDDTHEE